MEPNPFVPTPTSALRKSRTPLVSSRRGLRLPRAAARASAAREGPAAPPARTDVAFPRGGSPPSGWPAGFPPRAWSRRQPARGGSSRRSSGRSPGACLGSEETGGAPSPRALRRSANPNVLQRFVLVSYRERSRCTELAARSSLRLRLERTEAVARRTSARRAVSKADDALSRFLHSRKHPTRSRGKLAPPRRLEAARARASPDRAQDEARRTVCAAEMLRPSRDYAPRRWSRAAEMEWAAGWSKIATSRGRAPWRGSRWWLPRPRSSG